MKRIFLILIAAALMSSCIAVDNDDDANRAAKTFYVNASQWSYENGYYTYFGAWSKLNSSILDGATVNVTLRNGEAYQPLPFTMYNTDGNTFWERHIDYDYGPGGITFFYTDSQFYYEAPPESMEFRVVMTW